MTTSPSLQQLITIFKMNITKLYKIEDKSSQQDIS